VRVATKSGRYVGTGRVGTNASMPTRLTGDLEHEVAVLELVKAQQLQRGVGLAVAVHVDVDSREVALLELLVADLAVAIVVEAILANEVELRSRHLGEVDQVLAVEVNNNVGRVELLLEVFHLLEDEFVFEALGRRDVVDAGFACGAGAGLWIDIPFEEVGPRVGKELIRAKSADQQVVDSLDGLEDILANRAGDLVQDAGDVVCAAANVGDENSGIQVSLLLIPSYSKAMALLPSLSWK
jgi:hypothetical protein